MIGLEYGDANVVTVGATLTALESIRAQMWWHVREGMNMYEEDFKPGFAYLGARDNVWLTFKFYHCCLFQKCLFSDVEYVKELVGLGLLGLGKAEKSLCMLCREFVIRKVLWRR